MLSDLQVDAYSRVCFPGIMRSNDLSDWWTGFQDTTEDEIYEEMISEYANTAGKVVTAYVEWPVSSLMIAPQDNWRLIRIPHA